MNEDKMLKTHYTLYYLPDKNKDKNRELIAEEPLSINVQGNNYAVIMRTPGMEKEHTAGFCLAEGIVNTPEDFLDIALCDGDDSNVSAVKLTKTRAGKVAGLISGKGYISQTGCGLCGREIIDDLKENLTFIPPTFSISFTQAMNLVSRLKEIQKLRRRCFSSHAVALFDKEFNRLSEAEDVGRHNALDKSIGSLFLSKTLDRASIALLSSRTSYEMVQKCARAKIELIISMSRPTALAINLADNIGITVASVRDQGLYVFTRPERIHR